MIKRFTGIRKNDIAGSYNGSTADSESVYRGSNPCPATKILFVV